MTHRFEEIASVRASHPYAFRVPRLYGMVVGDSYDIEYEMYRQASRWCLDQFGSSLAHRWVHNTGSFSFSFRDQSDAMMFKIRWC